MSIHPHEVVKTDKGYRMPTPDYNKLFLILIVFFALVMGFRHFRDAFSKKPDGTWEMREEYKEHVEKKMESFDDCIVYELRVKKSGYYTCENCKNKTFYLNKNEIWKIGMTCKDNPRERYRQDFWDQMDLTLVPVFEGNSHECQKEEVRRLGNYSSTRENLIRPDPSSESYDKRRYKILYPPGNSSLR